MELPLTARLAWTLGVFAFCTIIFHALFIYVWRLDKIAWKRTDYVWLGLAALGLLSAAADVRRMIAPALVRTEEDRVGSAYDDARDQAHFLTGPSVCLKFKRSEWSPPGMDESQRVYDEACAYGRRLYSGLPPKAPASPDAVKLPARSEVRDEVLSESFSIFDRAWRKYVAANRRLEKAKLAGERTEIETFLSIVAPFLLAVALALRITKVTGEIRLEARRVQGKVCGLES